MAEPAEEPQKRVRDLSPAFEGRSAIGTTIQPTQPSQVVHIHHNDSQSGNKLACYLGIAILLLSIVICLFAVFVMERLDKQQNSRDNICNEAIQDHSQLLIAIFNHPTGKWPRGEAIVGALKDIVHVCAGLCPGDEKFVIC